MGLFGNASMKPIGLSAMDEQRKRMRQLKRKAPFIAIWLVLVPTVAWLAWNGGQQATDIIQSTAIILLAIRSWRT